MAAYRYAPHVIAGTPHPTAPKVVITMPAYHAERTLERTVLAIPEGVADELILVDDASTDGTVRLARRLGLTVHVHPTNQGYGGNQKSCYRLALDSGADIVVLLHPDYQYEPKAVPLLMAPILAGDADMTFGSRFAGMGDPLGSGMPMYRFLGNRATTIAQNILLGTRFTDMHSGMRAYSRRCLESLPFFAFDDGFPFDAQFLVDAVSSGLRVVEVPIPTRYTEESSSIGVGRSVRYVFLGTAYAARRGVARGRRGRHYLPAWRRSAQSARGQTPSAFSVPATERDGYAAPSGAPEHEDAAVTARGILAHVAGFNVPRRTILAITRTPSGGLFRLGGWAVAFTDITTLMKRRGASSGFPQGTESYGAIVLLDATRIGMTEEVLTEAQNLLEEGGLIALSDLPVERRSPRLSLRRQIGPPWVWRVCREAGLDVVEGHRTHRGAGVLIARPLTGDV